MVQGVIQKICSCYGHSEGHIIEIWLLQSLELLLFLKLKVVLLAITLSLIKDWISLFKVKVTEKVMSICPDDIS